MSYRTLIALGGVAATLGVLSSCYDPWGELPCYYGTFPVTGATGVSRNVEIALVAEALPADLPDLSRAVGLETAGGEPVEVDIDVEGSTVRLIPTAPPRGGADLRRVGDRRGGAGQRVAVARVPRGDLHDDHLRGGRDAAARRGGTGRRARALLAFSEPVDLDTPRLGPR